MPFRDEKEAQRARLEALESDLEVARRERDEAKAELDATRREAELDPTQLIDEATRERRRELELMEQEMKARERARATRERGSREPLLVAWHLRRGAHVGMLVAGGMGWLSLLSFGSTLSREHILPGERLAMQGAAGLSLVSALVGTFLLVRSLWSLQRFRERLPFALDAAGWGKLVDHPHFWIGEHWRHVVVGLEGGSREQVKTALRRLCERANRSFYSADDPRSDERVRWQVKGHKARGSASCATAYALVEWCRHDLAPLVRDEQVPLRVELTVSDEAFSVSRPSD